MLHHSHQRRLRLSHRRRAGLHRNGVSSGFLLNLIFYIIITPVISLTLTKIMFMSENAMIVADALERIDSVLTLRPLPETAHPQHPKDASVELSHVYFRYDGQTDVIRDVSLTIPTGWTVALVGPSGGESPPWPPLWPVSSIPRGAVSPSAG